MRRQLTGSSYWALVAANDALISAHFSHSDIGVGVSPKIGYSYPRLGSGKGGFPEWWRVGLDFTG